MDTARQKQSQFLFFYPDCTVGFGLSPKSCLSARGLVCKQHYRRWGLAPRLEDHINDIMIHYFRDLSRHSRIDADRQTVAPLVFRVTLMSVNPNKLHGVDF